MDDNKDIILPPAIVNTDDLKAESLRILNELIATSDTEKTNDLTYLFNQNQNKKTMVRTTKLNELLDLITDQAMERFQNHSNEITTKEIMDSLKTVSGLIESNQKQISTPTEAPLIQINQQTNEVNVGSEKKGNLNRDSREKVKNAVMSLLGGLDINSLSSVTIEDETVIDATQGDDNDN